MKKINRETGLIIANIVFILVCIIGFSRVIIYTSGILAVAIDGSGQVTSEETQWEFNIAGIDSLGIDTSVITPSGATGESSENTADKNNLSPEMIESINKELELSNNALNVDENTGNNVESPSTTEPEATQ